MNITSLRYQPVEGGALGGHFALHISIGGREAPGALLSPTELSTRIHDAFEKLSLKSNIKGVLIDCREAVGTTEEMSSLLETLKDWGYVRILWINEDTRYAWLEPTQHIVVFVRSQHWPNFRVNEIRYVMGKSPTWIEPDVYDVNGGATCYVIASPNAVGSDVLKFITGCKRPWGTLSRQSVAIDFKLENT